MLPITYEARRSVVILWSSVAAVSRARVAAVAHASASCVATPSTRRPTGAVLTQHYKDRPRVLFWYGLASIMSQCLSFEAAF